MQVYYTPQEIAQMLKVDIRTIYRWIRENKLTAVKIGHFWRVSESELHKVLGENEK